MNTLRVQQTPQGPRLTVDGVIPSPSPSPSPNFLDRMQNLTFKMNVAGEEVTRKMELGPQAEGHPQQYLVRGIELSKGQVVALGEGPGAEAALGVRTFAERAKPEAKDRKSSSQATPLFVRAAGGKGVPTDARADFVRHVSLGIRPRYVPTREGKAEPEEESAVADRLNLALQQKDQKFFSQLTGAARAPMKITWKFDGRDCGSSSNIDCANGKVINVQEMEPPSGAGRLFDIFASVINPDDPANVSVDVYFPNFDDTHVYELTITSTVLDELSTNQDIHTFHLWSAEQPIPGSGESAVQWVMRYAAGAAEVPPQAVSSCPKAPSNDLLLGIKNAHYRRCSMIRSFSRNLVEQGTMEVPDLQRLVEAVQVLHSTP